MTTHIIRLTDIPKINWKIEKPGMLHITAHDNIFLKRVEDWSYDFTEKEKASDLAQRLSVDTHNYIVVTDYQGQAVAAYSQGQKIA